MSCGGRREVVRSIFARVRYAKFVACSLELATASH